MKRNRKVKRGKGKRRKQYGGSYVSNGMKDPSTYQDHLGAIRDKYGSYV